MVISDMDRREKPGKGVALKNTNRFYIAAGLLGAAVLTVGGAPQLPSTSLTTTTVSAQQPAARKPGTPAWTTDLTAVLQRARQTRRPILVDFFATWCPPCIRMEQTTFEDKSVMAKLQGHELVRIDVDQQPGIAQQYGVSGMPTLLCLDPDGKEQQRKLGYTNPDEMMTLLNQCKAGKAVAARSGIWKWIR